MRPYYEHGGITIYHGDSREWMPSAEVVVADPPYGISLDTSGGRPGQKSYPKVFGDGEPFDPSRILSLNVPTVLFGANHYASRLPDAKGWLVWDKVTRNGVNQKQAEAEFAWTNFLSRPAIFRHMWMGGYRASERKEAYHPTQKPVALMQWVIGLCPPGIVLDPYSGAGSTLVAAKNLNRSAIGIEIEERYCEIAASRLSQEVLAIA